MREDDNRFWNLVKPLHNAAGAYCRQLMGNWDDGDDLYQEAIFRALTRFGQLRDPAAFRGWLYRIIVNCYRNQVTTPWWRRFERIGEAHENVPTPRNMAGQIHARRRLEVAMKPLSADDRALLLLFEVEGWSTSELAESSGNSVDAVKARLSRARKKMKAALQKHLKSVYGTDAKKLTGDENGICAVAKSKND